MQVKVEVTDEIIKTRNGNDLQVCFVYLGERYPERCTRFLGEGVDKLPAGDYVATKGRIQNYQPTVDLQQLTPLTKK